MLHIGCGRTHFYKIINGSKLEAVKLGRRTYVIAEALDAFIGALPKYRAPKACSVKCAAQKNSAGYSNDAE